MPEVKVEDAEIDPSGVEARRFTPAIQGAPEAMPLESSIFTAVG